eukprot:TRINITY_DN3149_c1_g1_i1.p1 TRINITY_DN3149_c1_g1~~TRINITY_DN3149_c1_g1_i1.p1  ORF type:complete len:186 (+),score=30.79 TRINITY_DN3149_c1_g1_i1:161-718(+)
MFSSDNVVFKLEGILMGIKFKKKSKWPWMAGNRESFRFYLIERLSHKQTMFEQSKELIDIFEALKHNAMLNNFGVFGLMINVCTNEKNNSANVYSLQFPLWWNFLGKYIYICPRSRRQNRIATCQLIEYYCFNQQDPFPELEYEAPPNIPCDSRIFDINHFESQFFYFNTFGPNYLVPIGKKPPL